MRNPWNSWRPPGLVGDRAAASKYKNMPLGRLLYFCVNGQIPNKNSTCPVDFPDADWHDWQAGGKLVYFQMHASYLAGTVESKIGQGQMRFGKKHKSDFLKKNFSGGRPMRNEFSVGPRKKYGFFSREPVNLDEAAAAHDQQQEQLRELRSSSERLCWACKEPIKLTATRCPHCTEVQTTAEQRRERAKRAIDNVHAATIMHCFWIILAFVFFMLMMNNDMFWESFFGF